MKIDEAIAYLEDSKTDESYGGLYLKHNDCIDTVIEIIQKQSEREKGCSYCSEKNPPELPDMGENTIYFNSLYGKFYNGEWKLDWTNCPMCGKKLEDKPCK